MERHRNSAHMKKTLIDHLGPTRTSDESRPGDSSPKFRKSRGERQTMGKHMPELTLIPSQDERTA